MLLSWSNTQRRVFTTIAASGLGLLFILLLHTWLTPDSAMALLWLDYRTSNSLYPLSVQNVSWIVFFIGLGELWGRFQDSRQESQQLRQHYLPEDERTVLQAEDLAGIYRRLRDTVGTTTELFLPRLIQRTILQFHSSRSIDQANNLLNSSLELYLHEIDLRYHMLRYIIWLIPSLGFMGTVIGISLALNYAGTVNLTEPTLLFELTQRLAVAFYTTLVGLIQAVIIVLLTHLIQAKEERGLNLVGQYCLDNLINRLYVQ